jgi:hypothetical protein
MWALSDSSVEQQLEPCSTFQNSPAHLRLGLAMPCSAAAQQHSIFAMLNSHPTLHAPAGWLFENMAHVVVSDPRRSPLPIYTNINATETTIPAPGIMISGNTGLGGIQAPFDFYWRPREITFPGVDAIIQCLGIAVYSQSNSSSCYSRPHRVSVTK